MRLPAAVNVLSLTVFFLVVNNDTVLEEVLVEPPIWELMCLEGVIGSVLCVVLCCGSLKKNMSYIYIYKVRELVCLCDEREYLLSR